MTTPDDAIPVSPPADRSPPEMDRRNVRGSFRRRAASACTTIRNRITTIPVLLVLASAAAAWWIFAQWRLGRIELTTSGEPVTVQVLAEKSDTPIGEPFDVARRMVLALPAGDYRLQVNGTGRLGRTYRFAVNRGEIQAHRLSLDEGRLLGREHAPATKPKLRLQDLLEDTEPAPEPRVRSIPFPPVIAALELNPGKASLIEWNKGSLTCRDGATGKILWNASQAAERFRSAFDLDPPVVPYLPGMPIPRSRFLDHAPDLDGDGTGDLVWISGIDAAIAALSGKDGSILWSYFVAPDGRAREPRPRGRPLQHNFIAGEPALTDVDRDGTPDLIATCLLSESSVQRHRRIVVGISGRKGRWLWTYQVDDKPINVPAMTAQRAAVLLQAGHSRLIAYVDSAQWLGLDPATGKLVAGPFDLGSTPLSPVQYADLDADGQPEVLALGPGPTGNQQTLTAFSLKTNRETWSVTTDLGYRPPDGDGPLRGLPTIVDLDADGRPEILVGDARYDAATFRIPRRAADRWFHGRCAVARGDATGSSHGRRRAWSRPLSRPISTATALPNWSLYPCSTRDSARQSMSMQSRAKTDAGSGGGRRICRKSLPRSAGRSGSAAVPTAGRFWRCRSQAKPKTTTPSLDFPVLGNDTASEPVVHLLEASTGRQQHTLIGLAQPRFADFDGDGLTDLWGDAGGELRAFRGEAPEAWRALGSFQRPSAPQGMAPELAASAAPV